MKDPAQLAAEAWNQIRYWQGALTSEQGTAIIKSAIEKAYQQGGLDMSESVAKMLEKPAAHASEVTFKVCEHVYSRQIDQPYPRHCLKCGEREQSAHASEHGADRLSLERAFREGYREGYSNGSSDCANYEHGAGSKSEASLAKEQDEAWLQSDAAMSQRTTTEK